MLVYVKKKQYFCSVKNEKKITYKYHKACAEYGLLEDGDHVLVGLSGGKEAKIGRAQRRERV